MSYRPYPIVEITDEGLRKPEHVGTKEKFWINYSDRLALVKFGRDNTGENWAEKASCELASLIGIQHAHYDFASFRGLPCVLSETIIPAGCDLVLGNQLIGKTDIAVGQAREYRRKEHTISRVLAAIIVQTRPRVTVACGSFCGYLMFDAWIGNTDRHEENWGLLFSREGSKTLAPSFDHASSLGRELQDSERARRLCTRDHRFAVPAFASKARSALFAEAGDRKPLRPIEAFTEVAKIFRHDALKWLDRLAKVDDAEVREIFARMPPGVITDTSSTFALELLRHNRAELLSFGEAR